MSTNCPACGRFARATSSTGYDGSQTQIWITTYCAGCGERTQAIL